MRIDKQSAFLLSVASVRFIVKHHFEYNLASYPFPTNSK